MADNDLNSLIEKSKSDTSASAGSSGGNNKLVSERSENSVLFSLSNLTAVGSAESVAKPGHAAGGYGNQGDKSGLIDLNTLARMGAGTSSEVPEGVTTGVEGGASAVPALFNVGTRRSNKGLVFGIAFLVIVVLGLGVFLTYLLVFKEETKPPASEQAKTEEPPEGEDLGVEGAAAANKGTEATVEGEGTDEANAEGEEGDADGEETAAAEGEEEEGDPATRDAVEDQRAQTETNDTRSTRTSRRSRGSDDNEGGVDSALDSIRSGGKKEKGKKLTPGDVKSVLQANSLKAKSCGSGGNLVTQFDIAANGKTRNVLAVGGSFKGKPEEACIMKVAKKMRFPANDGSVKGVKFPFKI